LILVNPDLRGGQPPHRRLPRRLVPRVGAQWPCL